MSHFIEWYFGPKLSEVVSYLGQSYLRNLKIEKKNYKNIIYAIFVDQIEKRVCITFDLTCTYSIKNRN